MDAPRFTAFRYMSRFRCLGGACEDTCCAGWEIPVDRPHFDALRRTMGRSDEERAAFEASHRLVPPKKRTHAKHALIVLQPSGTCALLAEDRTCTVHQRYGEDALADLCATYPRDIADLDGRLEMAGSTSCPEVARQLLLAEDALELDAVSGDRIGRPMVTRRIGGKLAPYERHHDAMRAFVCDLLSTGGPLAARLFVVAWFASESRPWFHRGVKQLDDAKLEALMAHADRADVQRELRAGFAALRVTNDLAFRLVLRLVEARARVPAIRSLVTDAVAAYVGGERAGDIPTTEVLEGYARARDAWERRLGDRLDLYFANYAKGYWVKEWFVASPDLLVHTQSLAVRLAVLRFLLFGHRLLRALPEGATHEEEHDALDRAVVDVVQKFSRAFEHDPRFLDAITTDLRAAGFDTLAHTAVLLRF